MSFFSKQLSIPALILSGILMASYSGESCASSFNTRLSNELLISGRGCIAEDAETCPEGLWLVIVDNLNRCSPEGHCTEIAVDPVVTELKQTDVVSASTLAFYDMIPLGPISDEQAQIMSKHWVRFDLNGDAIVLEK